MPVSGTLLNTAAVLVGSLLGLLLGGRLPDRFHRIIISGVGLAILLIGIQNALLTKNVLILLGSILIGGITGEILMLDDRVEHLGNYLQRRLESGKGESTFSEGFVTSSLIFCVGPMAVLGCIQNGISGDITLLALKSMLDGFTSFALAAALGWGVIASGASILLFQGAISLAAWAVATSVPGSDSPYITEMTAVGGLIILGIGLKLLDIKSLRLANYLPALAVAPALVWVVNNWPFR